MREMNYGAKREHKEKSDLETEKLIKNQECVSCKKLFTCKGKPRSVANCLNYDAREAK